MTAASITAFAPGRRTCLDLRHIHHDHWNIASATESDWRTRESVRAPAATCSPSGVSTMAADTSVTPTTAFDGTGLR